MKYLVPTLGGTVVGVGGLTYGGLEAYKKLKPKTWSELLRAEGFEVPNEETQDEDWKKIWWVLKEKSANGFLDGIDKTKKFSDVKPKCLEKLKEQVDRYSKDYTKDLEKIKKTCVREAPKNTKEWINHKIWEHSESTQEGLIIGSSASKEEYEIMFAVYRHEHEDKAGLPQFLAWLQSHSAKQDLSKDSDITTGGEELKKACEKLFGDKKTIDQSQHNNYRSGFMWCRKLPYTTVKDKIGRETTLEKETNWAELKKRWTDTPDVKKAIKGSDEEPEDNDYQTFCGTDTENKKLNGQDVYQKTYLVFKSVCYKQKAAVP